MQNIDKRIRLMNVVKDERFNGRILNQLREATAFVKTQICDYTKQGKNTVFQTILEYQEFCQNELIVNDMAHRDYSIDGSDTCIYCLMKEDW